MTSISQKLNTIKDFSKGPKKKLQKYTRFSFFASRNDWEHSII